VTTGRERGLESSRDLLAGIEVNDYAKAAKSITVRKRTSRKVTRGKFPPVI